MAILPNLQIHNLPLTYALRSVDEGEIMFVGVVASGFMVKYFEL